MLDPVEDLENIPSWFAMVLNLVVIYISVGLTLPSRRTGKRPKVKYKEMEI